jgi:hypothetical protein
VLLKQLVRLILTHSMYGSSHPTIHFILQVDPPPKYSSESATSYFSACKQLLGILANSHSIDDFAYLVECVEETFLSIFPLLRLFEAVGSF